MIIFAVEFRRGDVRANYFIVRSRKRLAQGLGFAGKIKVHDYGSESSVVIVQLFERLPAFWRYLVPFVFGAVLFVTGFSLSWWLLLSLVPLLGEVVLWSRFHAWLFKRGLSRTGYKGVLRTLSSDELINHWVQRG